MAAAYYSTQALDALLAHITGSGAARKILLVSDYLQGDPYATVLSRALGDADINNSNFIGPSSSGYDRYVTFTGITGFATDDNAGTGDHHIVITDGIGEILCVTDETAHLDIVSGNAINFPQFSIYATQPTLVP